MEPPRIEKLDAVLRDVLARLESGAIPDSERAEFTREIARLRDELVAARAQPSAGEPTTETPRPSKPSTSPSSELIERLVAHAPRESRYQLDGEIARGGMGTILKVFDLDLRRALAMKIALDGGAPLDAAKQRERDARFLDEAQITGQLDHPGVVPVHELGLDSEGRLYFTMRLVRGQDLGAIYELANHGRDDWTTARVLGVLLKVCEAMAYAHSKGVVHRDLKPTNVMVGRFGEVYVMDWGLAKVLGREDARDLRVRVPAATSISMLHSVRTEELAADPNTPLVTMDGTVLGTPAYMSPEQATGDLDAMDARSDVYALGAMLYQLLAGHAPYQDSDEKLDAHRLWLKIVRSPPTPLAVLAPRSPPELVAIVERAMAREKEARYPDVHALAVDLRAYLEGRVVGAFEAGTWAELRKWIGRNRALAAACGASVLIAIVGLAATSIVEARGRRAEQREAERVQLEASTNAHVLEFLTGMFKSQEPNRARGETVTVKQVLDETAGRMDAALEGDPEVRARLMETMGSVYYSLGLIPEAIQLAEQAVTVRTDAFGESEPASIQALARLGMLHLAAAQPWQAAPICEHVLELARRIHGDANVVTWNAQRTLARVYEAQGRAAEAEKLYVDTLEAQTRALGDSDPETVAAMLLLGTFYHAAGRFGDATPLLERALSIQRRTLGESAEPTLDTARLLAVVYQASGRTHDAEDLLRAVLAARVATSGPDNTETMNTRAQLALFLFAEHRYDEAEQELRATLAERRRVLGAHADTWSSVYHLARLLHGQGRDSEALPLAEELVKGARTDSPNFESYRKLYEDLQQTVQHDK